MFCLTAYCTQRTFYFNISILTFNCSILATPVGASPWRTLDLLSFYELYMLYVEHVLLEKNKIINNVIYNVLA